MLLLPLWPLPLTTKQSLFWTKQEAVGHEMCVFSDDIPTAVIHRPAIYPAGV